jgi:hypothetical protein
MSESAETARLPRNFLERILWLHGRKFWMAFFAGVSSFVIAIAGMWIVARTAPETARIVEQIVSGYLFAAAGLVTAYTAGNAVVERAHSGNSAAAPNPASTPRASGTVPGVSDNL